MSEEIIAADALIRENARLLAELVLLRELADDVRRWRESGGDPRDQGYILETLARIEKARQA